MTVEQSRQRTDRPAISSRATIVFPHWHWKEIATAAHSLSGKPIPLSRTSRPNSATGPRQAEALEYHPPGLCDE